MTVLGIDASNLREGGGRTHLVELLAHADPYLGPFRRVIVWASRETLALLPERGWLEPSHQAALDRGLLHRASWQSLRLPMLARGVDLLFAPGGVTTPLARPRVVMSRNMLPFEADVLAGYRGAMRIKMEVLRRVQTRSFSSADGLIFLTDYARAAIEPRLSRRARRVATIPHGVGDRFKMAPRRLPERGPIRLLYVSTVSQYKHQAELVAAAVALRAERPVELTLIGPDDGTGAAAALEALIRRHDPERRFLRYLGKVSFSEIHRRYEECDIFVYPSACENMPNILVEAMSSGRPIACSDRGPMPEVLRDGGVYFDPEAPASIAEAIRGLIADPERALAAAARAQAHAAAFRWTRCAEETFRFLASCLNTRTPGID